MLQHIIMNACGQNTQIYILTLIYLSIIVHVQMHGRRRHKPHNNTLYVAREPSLCSRLIEYLLLLMCLLLMHDIVWSSSLQTPNYKIYWLNLMADPLLSFVSCLPSHIQCSYYIISFNIFVYGKGQWQYFNHSLIAIKLFAKS